MLCAGKWTFLCYCVRRMLPCRGARDAFWIRVVKGRTMQASNIINGPTHKQHSFTAAGYNLSDVTLI